MGSGRHDYGKGVRKLRHSGFTLRNGTMSHGVGWPVEAGEVFPRASRKKCSHADSLVSAREPQAGLLPYRLSDTTHLPSKPSRL